MAIILFVFIRLGCKILGFLKVLIIYLCDSKINTAAKDAQYNRIGN